MFLVIFIPSIFLGVRTEDNKENKEDLVRNFVDFVSFVSFCQDNLPKLAGGCGKDVRQNEPNYQN